MEATGLVDFWASKVDGLFVPLDWLSEQLKEVNCGFDIESVTFGGKIQVYAIVYLQLNLIRVY